MKILALETNEERLKDQLISPSEQLLLAIHFSGFLFAARFIKALGATAVLGAIGFGLIYGGAPWEWVTLLLLGLWLPLIGISLLTAWIDWRYDVLLVTTDKVIIVDQSSIIRATIQQMNIENIASVTAHTQFADLLPFGKLWFDLKEGTGQRMVLPYVPRARAVASTIANIVMDFQSRRAVKAPNVQMHSGLQPQDL